MRNVGDCRNDRSVDSKTKAVVADSTAGSHYDTDNSDPPTVGISDDNVDKHRGDADPALKKRKIRSWGGPGYSDDSARSIKPFRYSSVPVAITGRRAWWKHTVAKIQEREHKVLCVT
ncbi:hypothetical protein MY4038_009764 [Beauveria bassiana]